MNTKTVLRWLKDEEKIRGSKKGSKKVKFQRQARFPEMEKRLYLEYRELRKKGMKARETQCARAGCPVSFINSFYFFTVGKEVVVSIKSQRNFNRTESRE